MFLKKEITLVTNMSLSKAKDKLKTIILPRYLEKEEFPSEFLFPNKLYGEITGDHFLIWMTEGVGCLFSIV